MKERLQCLLSEGGESFDYLRSDVRNLSRYMAKLEELIERYRAFAANVTHAPGLRSGSSAKAPEEDTSSVIGAPPDKPNEKS